MKIMFGADNARFARYIDECPITR